jgi:hypothetical protein
MTRRRRSLLLNINRPNFSNGDCPNNGDGVNVVGDQVAERWEQWDQMAMLQQLGLV